MLQISDFAEATLTTLTPRTEKHGDEEVSAVSLGIALTVGNTLLDTIDPDIREALYKRPDGQTFIPGVEDATVVLRCNSIDRATLPTKYEGWTLVIDDGIDDTASQEFGGRKLDRFTVEPKQGGSVVLRMRVGTSDLTDESSGFLMMRNGQSIWIKLKPPEKAPDAPAGDGGGQDQEPDGPSAGDLFVAGAGDGDELDGEPGQDAAPTEATVFPGAPAREVPVTHRRTRKGGLGTDADQAERQAEVLAKDPTMTPEKALADAVGAK